MRKLWYRSISILIFRAFLSLINLISFKIKCFHKDKFSTILFRLRFSDTNLYKFIYLVQWSQSSSFPFLPLWLFHSSMLLKTTIIFSLLRNLLQFQLLLPQVMIRELVKKLKTLLKMIPSHPPSKIKLLKSIKSQSNLKINPNQSTKPKSYQNNPNLNKIVPNLKKKQKIKIKLLNLKKSLSSLKIKPPNHKKKLPNLKKKWFNQILLQNLKIKK